MGQQAEMVAKEISLEASIAELNGRIEELTFAMENLKKKVDGLSHSLSRAAPLPAPNTLEATPPSYLQKKSATEAAPDVETAIDLETSDALERNKAKTAQATPPTEPASPKKSSQTETPKAAPSKTHIATPDSGAKLPDGPIQEQYVYARSLLSAKRYAEAEKAFSLFIKNHQNHEMAVNAIYWLGETYYTQGKFEKALTTFASGYDDHKNSTKAPDLLLKLSLTLEKLQQPKEACIAMQQLLSQTPLAASIQQAGKKLSDRLQCTSR